MTSACLIRSSDHVVEQFYRNAPYPAETVPDGYYVEDVDGEDSLNGHVHDPEAGTFTPAPETLDRLRNMAREAIMTERDRQIDGGIMFPAGSTGTRFQTRSQDRENIAGAAQLASMAIMAGSGEAGDYRWHGGDIDFAWIAEDDSLVTMDAPTVIAFARAAAIRKSACIFVARAKKDQVEAAVAGGDRAALESLDPSTGWPD